MTPLDRVGIYVPGGKAAYPSSVLMNAMPAQVAGVGEIVHGRAYAGRRAQRWCSPRLRSPASIACSPSAARRRSRALAYGTATIPAVDKIVGPGNAYVAAAKRRVFGTVGIDMIAGPTEILVICDGATDPDWIAMDLFSQAEHDEIAQAILLCPDARLHRRGGREASSGSCRDAAQGDHRGVARGARRADQGAATSRRPARSPTASRPSTWSFRSPSRSAGCRRSATPARSSSAATPPRRWATTAPARTTCCRPRAPRASPRRSASTISRSARA